MKYFVSVVDCGSFTEAGEQNYISQSAISQQIQALEKDLGVRLLIRENRKFSLTPAGEYFYSHCRGILEEAETLRRETVRLGKDSRLRLRIGYLRCYSGLELHEALAEFSRSCGEISIDVVKEMCIRDRDTREEVPGAVDIPTARALCLRDAGSLPGNGRAKDAGSQNIQSLRQSGGLDPAQRSRYKHMAAAGI